MKRTHHDEQLERIDNNTNLADRYPRKAQHALRFPLRTVAIAIFRWFDWNCEFLLRLITQTAS